MLAGVCLGSHDGEGLIKECSVLVGSRAGQMTSEYRGVCRHTHSRKWKARIKVGGKKKHLGYFSDEEEAARAYEEAALEVYGGKSSDIVQCGDDNAP